ncbi:hypothetical protein FOC4_g10007998 [Fusarium odoratissimum]|uniref:Uncharacterized protein n=2 Tax=Fusarium oxysporum species complex TaxID=171631 RepID=N1RH17_FUSC4|nr:hypothetical protein FOC4_g10007998 [Fusarium odoratissimum]TXC00108.1 hypothetical protein FocTR4_00014331 [Fusarium oxysporum f. sp. cubense]
MKNDKRAHSDLPGIAINFFQETSPSASASPHRRGCPPAFSRFKTGSRASIDLTVAFASPQIQDTVELPLHTPCRFVFAAAVNLSLFWVPEVAGFASPLMVAVSHPVQAHAGRRLRLSFDGRPVPTHAGGFASPLMTPLPLLYPSFGKQLAT